MVSVGTALHSALLSLRLWRRHRRVGAVAAGIELAALSRRSARARRGLLANQTALVGVPRGSACRYTARARIDRIRIAPNEGSQCGGAEMKSVDAGDGRGGLGADEVHGVGELALHFFHDGGDMHQGGVSRKSRGERRCVMTLDHLLQLFR